MGPVSKILVSSVIETIYVVLLLGGVAGLVLGAMLIVDSPRVFRINERWGRWISTHGLARRLDAPRKLELPIYRRHRLIGVALAAWSLYAIYVVAFSYSAGALAGLFPDTGRPVMLKIGLEAAQVILIVLNLFVLGIGVTLAVRPDLVRALEAWADRQYSTDQYVGRLDEVHDQAERFVRGHPKLVGWLLVFGSSFLLTTVGFVFLA
jgi:hypothetical protein